MVKIFDKAKAAISKISIGSSGFGSSSTARYRGKRKSILNEPKSTTTSNALKSEEVKREILSAIANNNSQKDNSSDNELPDDSQNSPSVGTTMMEGGSYSGDGDLGARSSSNSTNKKLQMTQAKVDEVVGIMKVNVDKVLERDQKLSELDNRADALQSGAAQFEQQAGKLKRKYWWKNIKLMIILGIIGTIFLILIIYMFIDDDKQST